jgi:hypothetical protein
MEINNNIPEPFQFNPLKHHLPFIKEFISLRLSDAKADEINSLVKELKHIGTSVMDIYTGSLTVSKILFEVGFYLKSNNLGNELVYSGWTVNTTNDFRIISLSDSSRWMLKYHDDRTRYVHLFPARESPHTFRIKSNTLKSAILYYIIIGKDFISREDLNKARELLELSPVKNSSETDAITKMIEILRK